MVRVDREGPVTRRAYGAPSAWRWMCGLLLFALAAPAPGLAQTTLWTATLTVGTTIDSSGNTIYGYEGAVPPLFGSVSTATFTRGTATVAVAQLKYNSGTDGKLDLQMFRTAGTTPSDGLLGSGPLTLTLGSATFAITSPGTLSALRFEFDPGGLSWSSGETVSVSLSIDAANNAPVITTTPPISQDEYEVWSATMTAGTGTVDSTSVDRRYPNVGYRSGAFGTLSDSTFTFDGESYTIRQISWAINTRDNGSRTHILYIAFDMRDPYILPGRAHQNLVFRGGGFDIQLSDNNPEPAGLRSSWGVYKYWFVANPNWSAGDSIEVSFVVPNRPLFDASPSAHHLVLSEDPPRYAGDSRRARNVRPSVEAIHPGGDTVRYTLEGRDAALFTIDETTGQIRTRADGVYDYETETRSCTQYFHQGPNRLSPCYEATVRATASGGTPATGGVIIELLDGRDGGLRNLRVEAPAGTTRELQVSWDAAAPDEQPDAYHVYWNTVDALSDRWFRTIVEGDGPGVLLQSLEANTEYRVQVQTRVGDVLGRRSETLLAGTGGGTPRNSKLRAEFQDVPPKHNSPFTVEVHFSEEVSLSYKTLRDHAFTVTNGAVTGARRLTPPSNIAWEIAVDSFSEEAVTVVLPETTDCAAPGAICTEDGRKLSAEISATVEGPAPPETRPDLTVRVERVPATHDGTSAFDVRLAFSEDLADDFSYTTLRDQAFTVTNGAVMGARRLTPPSNIAWEITVAPTGNDAVTLVLPATTTCAAADAICTEDERMLAHPLRTVIQGPPVEVSVADARVEEGAGAVLAFVVTLSRPASGSVRVDYATADGSALAGVDYTAASETLTFEAGESSQTIEVAVLEDLHDEDEETLTLTLSNLSGDHVSLADAEATGTIVNSDPLPRALMTRFGRTAAVHVVEHVEERLQAPRAPGLEGRVAGQALRPGMAREMALSVLSQLGASAGMPPAGMGGHGPIAGAPSAGAGTLATPGRGGDPLLAAAGPLGGGADGVTGQGRLPLGLGGGDLLTGSAIAMNRETRGGILSFWSRGAQSRFAGREGALSLGGDVRTTMVGADYARGPLVAGLSLAHSRGLGEYAGIAGGQVASSVTGLYPWLGYQAPSCGWSW